MPEFTHTEVLADAKAALERHPNPDMEYIVIDDVQYSARLLFAEMEQGTAIGNELLENWAEMMRCRDTLK